MMRKITCVCIAKAVDKFLGVLNSTQKGKEIPGYLAARVLHGLVHKLQTEIESVYLSIEFLRTT
jgi:hypothetical protein